MDIENIVSALYAGYSGGQIPELTDQEYRSLARLSIDRLPEHKSIKILNKLDPIHYMEEMLNRYHHNRIGLDKIEDVFLGKGIGRKTRIMLKYINSHLSSIRDIVSLIGGHEVVANHIAERLSYREEQYRTAAQDLLNSIGVKRSAVMACCDHLMDPISRPYSKDFLLSHVPDPQMLQFLRERSYEVDIRPYLKEIILSYPPTQGLRGLVQDLRDPHKRDFAYDVLTELDDNIHIYNALLKELPRIESGQIAEEIMCIRPMNNLMFDALNLAFQDEKKHPGLRRILEYHGPNKHTITLLINQLKFDRSRKMSIDILYSYDLDESGLKMLEKRFDDNNVGEYVRDIHFYSKNL